MHDRALVSAATWLLLAACTPVQRDEPPAPAPPRPPTQSDADAIAKPADLEPPLRAIGIQPCDEYVRRHTRCIEDKVPEAARFQMRSALVETWSAWFDTASGPARAGLPWVCRAAIDAMRVATSSLGCEWGMPPNSHGRVGVAECDAFVKAYGHCIDTQMPAHRRDALREALAWQIRDWQDASRFASADLPAKCNAARDAAKAAPAGRRCRW